MATWRDNDWYKRFRAWRKLSRRPAFPNILMIQTLSMCNAACTSCPYPGLTRQKAMPHGTMSDEMFERVVAEASQYPVARVSPYWNNEPMLDKKFAERLVRIRTLFPKSVVHISTNGSMLEKASWPLLAENLDRLHISCQGGVINRAAFEANFLKINYEEYLENVQGFLAFIGTQKSKRLRPENIAINNVVAFASKEHEQQEREFWQRFGVQCNFGGFNSYSGTITFQPRRISNTHPRIWGCADKDRPLQAMHVLFDGACVLCCNDWVREITVGNAAQDSLYDIWNSPAYLTQAKLIYSGSPLENHMCGRCDLAIR